MDKIIFINKKAQFNYFYKDKINVGIILHGWEVKSLKLKKLQLFNSYIFVDKKKEVWIKNMTIDPITTVDKSFNICTNREKKILVKKKEIKKISDFLLIKRNSIVPIIFYWKNSNIKIELAFVFGKKKIDKRNLIKQEEWKKNKIF